ncbi:MAG: hypothetical protein V5A23_04685 [Halobacteriales archaeon]
MHRLADRQPVHGPQLSPGVTLLRRPDGDARALYRLVGATLDGGHALWVDAGSRARTYDLDGLADRGALAGLRVARAFTAYQHRTLIDRAVARAGPRTDLLVAPCTAALYRDDDVPDGVARDLLADALGTLDDAADRDDVAVLLTATGDAALDERLAAAADRELDAVRTREDVRFEGDAAATVYQRRDGFQTTIDYWVDLFGCVCDAPAAPSGHAAVVG